MECVLKYLQEGFYHCIFLTFKNLTLILKFQRQVSATFLQSPFYLIHLIAVAIASIKCVHTCVYTYTERERKCKLQVNYKNKLEKYLTPKPCDIIL